MASLSGLSDPTLTIIFATSPTGFGHLRVTEALYHGLPKTVAPVLLGAQDASVNASYRFVSIHPFTRKIMEMMQMPPLDKPFAYIGRKLLRSQTKLIYQQLKTILDERLVVAKTVLLVVPHTILSHQLGEIKQKLADELGITILMVVQVTDDSPQAIWYVYDADLILAPSHYTKDHLLSYAKSENLPIVPIVVTAYPISPVFTEELSDEDFEKRLHQADPESRAEIHMTAPVSGTAVGTTFISDYMLHMHRLSHRFVFHVISKEALYTRSFITKVSQEPYVRMHTSPHDRTTVDNYERVFTEIPIALEITKPSEQTFKALTTPKNRGGVIMLFSKPVGGQEYDNLHFLRNHGLMPGKHEHQLLWAMAEKQESMPLELLMRARHWRALRLPDDPQKASVFTLWCLQQKIFSTMMHYVKKEHREELKDNGVEQFWTQVAKLLVDESK